MPSPDKKWSDDINYVGKPTRRISREEAKNDLADSPEAAKNDLANADPKKAKKLQKTLL
jgi:hypothetical protein